MSNHRQFWLTLPLFLAAACGGAGADEAPAEIRTGTNLTIKLDQRIDTRRTGIGSPLTGTLSVPVTDGDRVLIPAGSRVSGSVTAISSRPPRFSAEFTRIEIRGQETPFSATVRGQGMRAHSEMTKEGAKIGGGAAAGALLGGAIGGNVKSAAIGAAAGAAAGTGVAEATRRKYATLSSGSSVTATLDGALQVELPEGPETS